MRIGELGGFNVAVVFFHSHGKIDATEGGVNDIRRKELNENMKSMYM
jgi:hypothetical protein